MPALTEVVPPVLVHDKVYVLTPVEVKTPVGAFPLAANEPLQAPLAVQGLA